MTEDEFPCECLYTIYASTICAATYVSDEYEFLCECLYADTICTATDIRSGKLDQPTEAKRGKLPPQFDNWLGQWSKEELKCWQWEDHVL